ncbi:thymidylate synthase [Pseudozyma hubeiensis SY62]|uniref:Thymidylate synthase n=1 Tax=Pseudozyma hubeiensis (strain SY62) TaxID=1305764 RepID=R9PCE7_PSEHS|nr:thymidylate synthase [Pseudozyma hubeiensis SY62]GAC99083.1 thymidylate synthase [Pseudozyma hubeiensis SY62]
MEVGTHCELSTCGRLSFLPISCPLCTTTFCESHFLPEQHRCDKASSTSKALSDDELFERIASTGSSGRLPCQKQGCKKLSFHVQTQPSTSADSNAAGFQRTFTHAAPRCERCRGLFCAVHRSATSHGCTAPPPMTEGQQKLKAIEDRKKKAAALIAKNFPNRKA